jgi:hypothetical protein
MNLNSLQRASARLVTPHYGRHVMLAIDTTASFHDLCSKRPEREAIAWLSSHQGIDKVNKSRLLVTLLK